MGFISVWDSKEIQTAIVALKIANKEIRKEVYKRTREKVLPEWRQTVADNISSWSFDSLGYRLLLNSTRVDVSPENITMRAATSKRTSTRGKLIPAFDYYLYEFGGTPHKGQVHGRRGNTRYYYTRQLGTGLPKRRKKGRAAYPAAARLAHRSIALWVSSIIQVYNDAMRGKTL